MDSFNDDKIDLEEIQDIDNIMDQEDIRGSFLRTLEKEIDRLPYGGMIVNEVAIVEYVNEHTCVLFKYAREEMEESNVSMLVPEHVRPKHNSNVDKFFNGNTDIPWGSFTGINKYDRNLDLIISVECRKVQIDDSEVKFAMVYIEDYDARFYKDSYAFFPVSTPNFINNFIILAFVFYEMQDLPYMLVLNLPTDFMTYVLFAVHMADMIFQLNVGYKTAEDRYVLDHELIALNYLKTWFLIDLIGNFPYFMFWYTLEYIHMLRFVRGVRAYMRLKEFNILEKVRKVALKNKVMRKVWVNVSNTYGLAALLLVLVLYYAVIHYSVLIFFIMELNLDAADYPDTFFNAYGGAARALFESQPEQFYEDSLEDSFIKAFKYESLALMNKAESYFLIYQMAVLYIFLIVILSVVTMELFSIIIKKIDMIKKFRIIDSLTSNKDISDDMLTILTKNIQETYEKNKYSVEIMKPFLSKDLYDRVQKSLFSQMISDFPLFKSFNYDVLSVIYTNGIRRSDIVDIYKYNSVSDQLLFIVNGTITLRDVYYNLVEIYEDNMIVGMPEYNQYVSKKYEIEFNDLASEKNNNKFNKRKSQVDAIDQNITEDAPIKYKYFAIGSSDVSYIEVKYQTLDDIYELDNTINFRLNKYVKLQRSKINPNDRTANQKMLEIFDCAEQCELIILDNEKSHENLKIVKVNKMFEEEFENSNIIGKYYNTVVFDSNKNKIENLDDMKKMKYICINCSGSKKTYECNFQTVDYISNKENSNGLEDQIMGKAIIIGFNSEEERDSDHTDPNLSIKHKDNSNK